MLKPACFRSAGTDFIFWSQTKLIDAKTRKVTARVSYAELEQSFGYRYYLCHRVDLHNGLKALALRAGSDRTSVVLRLSSEISEIDCESGVLTAKDGTRIAKDLIIVADGVHVSTMPPSTNLNDDIRNSNNLC